MRPKDPDRRNWYYSPAVSRRHGSGGQPGGTTGSAAASSASPSEATPASGYMPALDGVRALAVAAVLLYHGDVSWARGGYLGVDAFFVLSGFLITSLLAGRMAPPRSDRAAGVLGPAGATAPAGAVPRPRRRRRSYGAVIAAPAELAHLRNDGLASALGYVANWGRSSRTSRTSSRSRRRRPCGTPGRSRSRSSSTLVWPLLVAGVLRWRRGSIRIAHRRDRRAAGGVGRVDDRALRAGRRPDARLLRDRHARAVVADGRAARAVVDAAAPAAGCERDPRAPRWRVAWRPSGSDGSGCTRPRRPAGSTAAGSHCARCSSRSCIASVTRPMPGLSGRAPVRPAVALGR